MTSIFAVRFNYYYGIIAALITFITGHFANAGDTSPSGKLAIKKCKNPPVIDGKLNDSAWINAPAYTSFYVLGSNKKSNDTAVKILCDNQWLYLGVTCRHPDPKAMEQSEFNHDGTLFKDDSLEFFLVPDPGRKKYYHFMLNFGNVRGERIIEGKTRNVGWNLPWRSATWKTDSGWTAEVALPLFLMFADGKHADMRINLTRNQVIPQFDQGAVRVGTKINLVTLATLVKSFHEIKRFPGITGLENIDPHAPFMPAITDIQLAGYRKVRGKYAYTVTASIHNAGAKSGKITVEVEDKTSDGKSNVFSKIAEIDAGARKSISIRVPVKSLAARSVSVKIRNQRTEEIWQEVTFRNPSKLQVMAKPLVGKNYYTGETCARIRCRFGLPERELIKFHLNAINRSGNVIASESKLLPVTYLKIPLDGIKTRTDNLIVQLRNSNGVKVLEYPVKIDKLKPNPGHETKISNFGNYVLLNDKPFFPYGLVVVGSANNEKMLRKIAAHGFNTVVHWKEGDPRDVPAYLDLAKKYGLMVIEGPMFYSNKKKARFIQMKDQITRNRGIFKNKPKSVQRKIFMDAFRENLPRMLETVKISRNYPNLLCYFSLDEPHPQAFDVVIDACKQLYLKTRKLDPYRPMWINYGSGGFMPPAPDATRWCEIISADPYWTPPSGKQTKLNTVSVITANMKKRADRDHKVVWSVPMAENYSGTLKRYILPREQICQTYLALIHGARGIIYFYAPVKHRASWDNFKILANRIKKLEPALIGENLSRQVSILRGKSDNRTFPDIQISLRPYKNNEYVLLAANCQYYPVDVQFSIPELDGKFSVKSMFHNQQPDRTGIGFSDNFSGYGTRAYLINTTRKITSGTVVNVRMTPHPEQVKPEQEYIKSIKGNKDISPNPGFENAVVPGMPDYIQPFVIQCPVGFEKDGGFFGQTEKGPYEGKYCLFMKPFMRGNTLRSGFFFKFPNPGGQTAYYTVSVYLKAAKKGTKGCFWKVDRKWFEIPTEWTRFTRVVRVPENAIWIGFSLYVKGDSMVWADALRIKKNPDKK